MDLGFWTKLKKPIMVLAPMADVTDAAFRRIIAKYSTMGKSGGGPDVMWTEFVSADGLILASPEGKEKLMKDLIYSESERPIVAQLFGGNPENMEKASKLVAELGFDGLDINMGCPDRSIEKQGAGAASMKNLKLAKSIIQAAKRGIASSGRDIPVSVKTRIGYNKPELETWLPAILLEDLAVVTIHARTRKEMSDVPARWEFVKRAVEIRNEMKVDTLIFGNGDVVDVEDGRKKCEETGADGAMLGRAIFGNPFLFANLAQIKSGRKIERPVSILPPISNEDNLSRKNNFENGAQSRNSAEQSECAPTQESRKIGTGIYVPTLEKKLQVLIEHSKLFEELLGGTKNFAIMKKHFKAYVLGFDGAKDLRVRLMEANNAKDVEMIIENFKIPDFKDVLTSLVQKAKL